MLDLILLAAPVFLGWAVSHGILEPMNCNDGERWRADL